MNSMRITKGSRTSKAPGMARAVLCLLLALGTARAGDGQLTVRGSVRDGNGQPVVDAELILWRVVGHRRGRRCESFRAKTADDGSFELGAVGLGTYPLVVVNGPRGLVTVGEDLDLKAGHADPLPLVYQRSPGRQVAVLELPERVRAQALATVQLRDDLGWRFENERITAKFPADKLRPGQGVRVVRPDGGEVAAQLLSADDGAKEREVMFLATVEKWSGVVYAVVPATVPAATRPELPQGPEPGTAVLTTAHLRVLVPGPGESRPRVPLSAVLPPVVSVAGPTGSWLGRARLIGDARVDRLLAEVSDSGKLFVEYQVSYFGGDRLLYRAKLRLYHDANHVIVSDSAFLESPHQLQYSLAPGLSADAVSGRPTGPEPRGQLGWLGSMPWPPVYWYLSRGVEESTPALTVFTLDRARWRFPYYGTLRLYKDDDGLYFTAPLTSPQRLWGLAVSDLKTAHEGRLGDRLMSRLADNALDRLRHALVPTPAPQPDRFPLFTPEHGWDHGLPKGDDLELTLSRRHRLFEGSKEQPPQPRNGWKSAGAFEPSARGLLDRSYASLSMNHNANSWNLMLHHYDHVAAHPGLMSVQQQRTAQVAIALLAYKLADPEWWQWHRHKLHPTHPESIHGLYGIRGTPAYWCGSSNQNVDRYWTLVDAALLLPEHPLSSRWLEHALEEFDRDLRDYYLQEKIWPEGTRYAAFNLNNWLLLADTLQRHGIRDYFREPYFQRQYEYLLQVLTPPDQRWGGTGVLPPIGDSNDRPGSEANTLYNAAHLFKRVDPVFAGRLLFAWERSKQSPERPPTIPGIAKRPGPVKPIDPQLKSQLIPGYGAILRHRYGRDDETYMLIKNSRAAQHWHRDELGFHFYALGHLVFGDPGGYYSFPSEYQHNVVGFHRRDSWNRGDPKDFRTLPQADLFVGEVVKRNFAHEPPRQNEDGSEFLRAPSYWARHVLFIKEPCLFVFYEDLQSLSSADLYLQGVCESMRLDGATAHFSNRFGVETDVRLLEPAGLEFRSAASYEGQPWNHPRGKSLMATAGPGVDLQWTICPYQKGPEAWQVSGRDGRTQIRRRSSRYDIWLSPRTMRYEEDDVRFHGAAGYVAQEESSTSLVLLSGYQIAAAGYGMISSDSPICARWRGSETEIASTGRSKLVTLWQEGVTLSKPVALLDGQPHRSEIVQGRVRVAVPRGAHTLSIRAGR